MNNTELFAKYFDNSFSEEEKLSFEKRLLEEIELKKEFDKFMEFFGSMKKEVEVDEGYFSTILPNARKRIDEKQKLPKVSFFNYKLTYIIPIVLLAAFFVYKFLIFTPQQNDELSFEQIISELSQNKDAAKEILNETLHSSYDYQFDQKIYSMVYDENDYNKLLFNYAEANQNFIDVNENLINQLSENEINLLYKKIINKKIL